MSARLLAYLLAGPREGLPTRHQIVTFDNRYSRKFQTGAVARLVMKISLGSKPDQLDRTKGC